MFGGSYDFLWPYPISLKTNGVLHLNICFKYSKNQLNLIFIEEKFLNFIMMQNDLENSKT